MIAKKQLSLYTGETFRHTFYYFDVDGNAVDLTGCTAKMEVRSLLDPTKIYLVLSSDNSRLTVDVVNSGVIISIPDEDTVDANIQWKEGAYDVRVTFPDGEVDTLAYGKMVVKKGITALP